MTMWLLRADVLQAMRAGRAAGYQPTLEERARFAAAMREAYASRPEDQPRNMSIADGVATIAIDGVLTEEPDCFALLFGGGNTSYESIRRALAKAEADPSVKRVQLLIDSPGGEVRGLFETFAALDAVTKPISVRASLAASAAYGLAAVAGPIEASTPASEFGSIGVAVRYYTDEDAVDIASTEAPKKRPDMTTDEGKAVVREELDALHDLFASAIAKGRSASTGDEITAAMVNAEFGRGGVFLAGAAKRAGMIDKIAKQPARTRPGGKRAEEFAEPIATQPTNPSASEGGSAETREPAPPAEPQPQTRTKEMNKAELQAQHPELYASIVAEGEAKERKRVNAHLKMAKSHNAMDIAMTAIASGASLSDEEVLADYLSAGKNKDAQAARQADSDAAGAATSNASPPAADPKAATSADAELDEGDLVARALNLPLPKASK